MKNYSFYRSLHARGVTLDSLAEELATTPSHLSAVFNGQRGSHSRKHIVKHLTADEREMLGWDEKGKLREQVRTCENVPRETS